MRCVKKTFYQQKQAFHQQETQFRQRYLHEKLFCIKKNYLCCSINKHFNLYKTKIMNKSELVNAIAEKSGLTKTDSKKALDAFLDSTMDALKKGDKVALVGFGTWAIKERAERQGRNPQTGKEITIPAKKVVKFKVGAELSRSV